MSRRSVQDVIAASELFDPTDRGDEEDYGEADAADQAEAALMLVQVERSPLRTVENVQDALSEVMQHALNGRVGAAHAKVAADLLKTAADLALKKHIPAGAQPNQHIVQVNVGGQQASSAGPYAFTAIQPQIPVAAPAPRVIEAPAEEKEAPPVEMPPFWRSP